MTNTHVRYIPKGLKIDDDGHYNYTEQVGVRLTPGDPVAHLELTQEMVEVGEEGTVTQHIGLSLSQMRTLHAVLEQQLRLVGALDD